MNAVQVFPSSPLVRGDSQGAMARGRERTGRGAMEPLSRSPLLEGKTIKVSMG